MSKLQCLSVTALKRFACIAMLIDHIGASCLELGLGISYVSIWNIGLISQMSSDATTIKLLYLNCILRAIGRFAMPIFCFFVAEGFLHTRNAWHYLGRLVCFGLIAEPVFDFAFFGSFYYPSYQNIYPTLSLGLIGLMLLKKWDEIDMGRSQTKAFAWMFLLGSGLFVAVYAADYLHTDYGSTGALLILLVYMVRRNRSMQSLAVAVMTYDQFPAPFAAIPLALYNGNLGNCSRRERLGFYAFYPAHLLILGLITNFILL